MQRRHGEAAALVGRRILLGQVAAEQGQLRLRLPQGEAGAEAGDHGDRMRLAALHVRQRVLAYRRINIGLVAVQAEVRRRDTYSRAALAIENQRSTERGRGSREM